MTIQFKFEYSPKYLKEQWILTGKEPKATGVFNVDETTLAPEQRVIIAPHLGGNSGFSRDPLWTVTLATYSQSGYAVKETPMKFDATPTLEDILAILPDMAAKHEAARQLVEELEALEIKEQAEKKERQRAEWAAQDAEKAKREAAEEATKAKRLAEREAWVKEHGSERLRKCLDKGYNCTRLYVVERASLEYPGFTLDYNDNASWGDRSGPSLEALNKQEELEKLYPDHEIEIVWLKAPATNDPEEDSESYYFEAGEAIVMRPPSSGDSYLYKSGYGMLWLVMDL